jgi:hypothetical protein
VKKLAQKSKKLCKTVENKKRLRMHKSNSVHENLNMSSGNKEKLNLMYNPNLNPSEMDDININQFPAEPTVKPFTMGPNAFSN